MQVEEVIRAAQKRTGLEAFDSDSFREPLELLVAGVNARSDYSETGIETMTDSASPTTCAGIRSWRAHRSTCP
jgi:hypothetical protein